MAAQNSSAKTTPLLNDRSSLRTRSALPGRKLKPRYGRIAGLTLLALSPFLAYVLLLPKEAAVDAPSQTNEINHRPVKALPIRVATAKWTPCVAAVEHEF